MDIDMSSVFIYARSRLHRKKLTIALAFLAALTLLYAYPALTLAHGEYVSSNPAANAMLTKAPQLITVHFAENLTSQGSNMLVYDMNGKVVSNAPAKLNLTDPKTMSVMLHADNSEIYVVYWYNVSAVEGHHDSGSFRFFVHPDAMLRGTLTNDSMNRMTSHAQQHAESSPQQQPSQLEIANKTVPLWITGVLCLSGLILGAWVMSLFMRKYQQPEDPPIPDSPSEIPLERP